MSHPGTFESVPVRGIPKSSDQDTSPPSNTTLGSTDREVATRAYDTIRYDTMHLRALKSWRYGQFSLAHGTETKIRKNEKQNNE